jgi:hypothetical protein
VNTRICWLLLAVFTISFCAFGQAPPPAIGPTILVSGIAPGQPIKLVAYGDIRFTETTDTSDTNPRVRQFLVRSVADERPLAIFLTGDTPFIGSNPADWAIYQQETAAWKAEHLWIFPATGNHEVKGGHEAGIANYLKNFPELKGHLYYSAQIGNVYLISLDTTQPSGPGSPQRTWFQSQLEHLPPNVDFVFILDHMPWMNDVQTQIAAGLPGADEISLRAFLEAEAPKAHAKFIVINGHIHNYERFERNGITYLVSGGGGAKPYPVLIRGSEDLYRGPDEKTPPPHINYHYLVIQIAGKRAEFTMRRVVDPGASALALEARDHFTVVNNEQVK